MKGLIYVSPIGNRKVALFKLGQWVEVYPGEVILIHPSLYEELKTEMKKSKGQKIYKSMKKAKEAKNNRKLISKI